MDKRRPGHLPGNEGPWLAVYCLQGMVNELIAHDALARSLRMKVAFGRIALVTAESPTTLADLPHFGIKYHFI